MTEIREKYFVVFLEAVFHLILGVQPFLWKSGYNLCSLDADAGYLNHAAADWPAPLGPPA